MRNTDAKGNVVFLECCKKTVLDSKGQDSGYHKNAAHFLPVSIFFFHFNLKLVSCMQGRDENLLVNAHNLILNNL